QTGHYRDAMNRLLAKSKGNEKNLGLQHALGLAYENLGMHKEAQKLWNLFYDDSDAGLLDANNPFQQFYVAEAARFLGSVADADKGYQDIPDIDPEFHAASLRIGQMMLRKYAPNDAEIFFEDVLKINPKHPDALAAMAIRKVSMNSYDVAGAQEYVDKALAINPNQISAMLVSAGIAIDKNQWEKAKKIARRALKVNPESFNARAILATVYWLRDDMVAYEAEKKRVLDINPRYSEFYHILMRSVEREHRYAKGVELAKEAVAINPRDYEAMQLVGSGYLRLGNEKEGTKWLRKAYYGDQYNVRTVNTLGLFEKHIPRNYVTTKSKHFKIRFHKEERPVLERYITPMVETAFEGMVKRYGFTPTLPITIELYKDPQHYSTRTIGLPGLGALGVCFGEVVTAMSPSMGDLNWSMVLWHELSHVFALQLSNMRVPRWYTEGLSEYETIRARPEWRREQDADLWAAMQDNTLPGVAELNDAFMRPSNREVVVAYHLSSVTIEYLVAEYGFDKIVLGLKLFGKGKETPEVITAITGKSVATFDKEFRAHLARRLAPYKGSLYLPTKGLDDTDAIKKIAEKSPKNANAQARLALSYFYAGNAKGADKSAKAALVLNEKNPIALYISAELAMKSKKLDNAKLIYETLIVTGNDSFDVRVRLSMLAARAKDKVAFVGHLESAKILDPERSYPYETLAEFYETEKLEKEMLGELETYVMIEQMSFGHVFKLVTTYAAKNNWQKVIHYGELAVSINPSHGKLQLALGKAYAKTGANDNALFAYDTALLVHPRLRRPALAYVGRAEVLLQMGKKKQAKKALQYALDVEPDNAQALKLQSSM
ncbi:MAG: hypothetical protein JKY56_21950, partial [Kofleriaceae bacterium]|nr:hypothetical protein [Kofleriaceae bacterium]